MPRAARLDDPGILHHVMVRGITGQFIFLDERDRGDFLRRLAALAQSGAVRVLAWALLANHAHLLLRTANKPLAAVMRSLLTGYAGAFNRRHRRTGHLFQNRYKSIVVEDDPYLLQLARYIHLNPLRAGLVRELSALDRYPWTGHSALMGLVPRRWQATDEILGHFHRTAGAARQRYRKFVAEGIPQGRRSDLQGGGLRRSAGGWLRVATLRRGRERWASDERILGSGPFVERLLREVAPRIPARVADAARIVPRLAARLAAEFGVDVVQLMAGNRRRPVVHARAAVSAVAVAHLGLPVSHVARALSITTMPVVRAVPRGLGALRQRGLDPERLAREAKKG